MLVYIHEKSLEVIPIMFRRHKKVSRWHAAPPKAASVGEENLQEQKGKIREPDGMFERSPPFPACSKVKA
jgi:hypothetical protein